MWTNLSELIKLSFFSKATKRGLLQGCVIQVDFLGEQSYYTYELAMELF